MSRYEPAIHIIKTGEKSCLDIQRVIRREQTCSAHLVLGGNVVFHQDWDSMKETVLFCEYCRRRTIFFLSDMNLPANCA